MVDAALKPTLDRISATIDASPHLLRLGALVNDTVLLEVDGDAYYLTFHRGRLENIACGQNRKTPLYSPEPELHDHLVGKPGAFRQLERSLAIFARAGAAIELRTVVMKQNNSSLPALSDYVHAKLPFIQHWALMQLENIGYGRMNWEKCFIDTSTDFGAVGIALSRALARGIEVSLFNFPLCTVPQPYRHLAPSTISDWKRKFLPECSGCPLAATCGGFFEWYSREKGFIRMGLREA